MTITYGNHSGATSNAIDCLLSYVNTGEEIENYAVSEIEAAPIADIAARLDEFGLDTSVPSPIASFVHARVTLAERVIDALSENDWLEDDIEHMPAEEVAVKLNSTGLNHLAGFARLRELIAAAGDAEKHARDVVRPETLRNNVVRLVSTNSRWITDKISVRAALSAAAVVLAMVFAHELYYTTQTLQQVRQQDAALQRQDAELRQRDAELRHKYLTLSDRIAEFEKDYTISPTRPQASARIIRVPHGRL